MLRDLYPANLKTTPILSFYTVLLVAYGLRGIFYPANFLFPSVSRFLLQRAELDQDDIPMLLSMLYSSSDVWRKERGWMLRFLRDGITSRHEWKLLEKKHVIDMLCSFFEATDRNEHVIRFGILEVSLAIPFRWVVGRLMNAQVLSAVTLIAGSTTTLIVRSSFLTWMESQIQSCVKPEGRGDERSHWAQIIHNIVHSVPTDKIEKLTRGQWQFEINRCIRSLVSQNRTLLSYLDI